MISFTKEKFTSLTEKRQHKHAARILREILEKQADIESYFSVCDHFKLAKPDTLEQLAERFHYHLEKAEISPSEGDLLQIKKGDNKSGSAFLEIDIYLDNLRSAHNVGSIIRTTEAFRLGEIYCGGNTPSHEKIEKTSMHSHNEVTIHRQATLDNLTKRPMVALETAKNAISLNEFVFPKSFSLILGNEELGVSEEGLQLADFIVEIPLYGVKNSLNVASAFTIVADKIRNR